MRMRRFYFLIFLVLFSIFSHDLLARALDSESVFSGRIISVNEEASLMRVKIDFDNAKYLNRDDSAVFWHESNGELRCRGVLVGKSPGYFLFRIYDFSFCRRSLPLDWGRYLLFESQDLANNLEVGRHLVDILLTRRIALKGRLENRKRELQTHIERVEAVNKRYQVLRQKLEAEWKSELHALEEDRVTTVREYEHTRVQLDELHHKLERYHIKDDNLTEDRWALDPRLYYKK